VVNDSLDEPDETVQLTLSAPQNATLGSVTDHVLTIVDDDPPTQVGFAQPSSSAGEWTGSAQIEVRLAAVSGQTVTVDYAVTGGTATGGGVDYPLANGTLTFQPGQPSQFITVALVNDSQDEPDETVQISLTGATNATVESAATHTLTILDDDPQAAFATA